MNIAYIRSKNHDSVEKQRNVLKKHHIDNWYIEELNSKKKPMLDKMISDLKVGDIVFIDNIFRLSRNTKELGEIFDLIKEKEARIQIENLPYDSNSCEGKLMFSMALVIKQELDKIEEELS